MRWSQRFLLVLSSLAAISFAAFSEPDWLKETVKSAKTSNVSSLAGCCVLLEKREVEFEGIEDVHTHVRRVVQLLRSDDEDDGCVFMALTTPRVTIKHLRGWLITGSEGDSRVVELRDEDVVRSSGSRTAGYYDETQNMRAEFPALKPHDIVAFEYDIVEAEWEAMYHQYLIQVQDPVVTYQLDFICPKGWTLKISGRNLDSTHLNQVDEHTQRVTWHDLSYVPEEPYMPSWRLLEKNLFVVALPPEGKRGAIDFSTWNAVARWASLNLYKQPAVPESDVSATANAIVLHEETRSGKIRALSHFVRDKIRYVAVELGKGSFQPRQAGVTLGNAFGDCKDKSVLLCALLTAIGVNAVPALTSVLRRIPTDLPSPFHFNHCIVAIDQSDLPESTFVAAAAGGWVFFDPTCEGAALGSLPAELLTAPALVITPRESTLAQLPEFPTDAFHRRYTGTLTLSPDGGYTGHITITDYKCWAMVSPWDSRNDPKIVDHLQSQFSRLLPGAIYTNIHNGAQGDSAWVKFDVSGLQYLTNTGAITLFKPDPFHPVETSPFLNVARVHPVYLNALGQIETDVQWMIPGGIDVEIEPEAIHDSCRAYLFISTTESAAAKHIHTHSYEQYTGDTVPVSEYPALRKAWATRCRAFSETAIVK